MDIPIIFEDEHLLVLNKPAGLVAHPDGRTTEPSVTGWLMEHYPALAEVGGNLELPGGGGTGSAARGSVPRCGLVHRLDRETSGVIVVAKDQPTFDYLQNQFQTRNVHKIYHAIVYGQIKDNEGVIDLPIGRNRTDFRQWSAEKTARGALREAVTHFKVLERNPKFTFVEVEPKTGRTHQIRVHFKALQHPVVSDGLYAQNMPKALGFERFALHARSISFLDMAGEKRSFTAEYPDDFVHGLELMKTVAN